VHVHVHAHVHVQHAYGQAKAAERLRVEFRVPDKRWWRLKTRGLAHAQQWDTLWCTALRS
jgi:hypothetical protein